MTRSCCFPKSKTVAINSAFLIQFRKLSCKAAYISTTHSWNQFLFPYCKLHIVQHTACLQPLCALPAIYLYHISPNRLNMLESLHNNMPFTALLNVCIFEINSLRTDYACFSVFCDMQQPARAVTCVTKKFSSNLYFSYIFISYKILLKHITLIRKCFIQPTHTCRS